MKRALITGITGQDGAYLAKLLIERDTKFMEQYAEVLLRSLLT